MKKVISCYEGNLVNPALIKIVFARLVLICFALVGINACTDPDQSLLLYRLPYENNENVKVWQDHLTHSPLTRIDLKGTAGSSPYAIVASATGVVRIIEDGLTQNCCKGTCGNNYVWLEHIAGEWTKYSHLATNSVTVDANLSPGDLVLAGEFLGWESNVGRACGSGNGVHLHTEVNQVSDASPAVTGNAGALNGTNKIPRYCGVSGQIVVKDNIYPAKHCDNILECIRSIESPSTEGMCTDEISGEVCVQEISNPVFSTFTQGVDFDSTSVHINLDWCGDESCDPAVTTGRALHVIVQPQDLNEDPILFIANCQNRLVDEVLHNVSEIIIQEAPNLSDENLACGGNSVLYAFARWEICEISPFFESLN